MGSSHSAKSSITIQSEQSPSKSPWKRLNLIGEGDFSKVFECQNLQTDELCALKSIEFSTPDAEAQLLNEEMKFLSSLSHNNVLKYMTTEITSDNSAIEIVMEYMPGGSIRSMLDKFSKLYEKTAKKYILQLLEGLSYLHSKGIVHRNLKCTNLLLDNDGTIKISDMKIHTIISWLNKKSNKHLKHHSYWLAPEIAKNNQSATSADVWAVGCIAIEMLTGYPPWYKTTKNSEEALKKVKKCKEFIDIPKHVSPECTDFLKQCLNVNPSLRPSVDDLRNHSFFCPDHVDHNISDFEYLIDSDRAKRIKPVVAFEIHSSEEEYSDEEYYDEQVDFYDLKYDQYAEHDEYLANKSED